MHLAGPKLATTTDCAFLTLGGLARNSKLQKEHAVVMRCSHQLRYLKCEEKRRGGINWGLPSCMRGKSRNRKAPAFAVASFYTAIIQVIKNF